MHPVHPALVHFPVACWSLGSAADIASYQLGFDTGREGTMLIIAGMLLSVLAIFSGLLELGNIEQGSAAQKVVITHIYCVAATWMFYGMSLYLRMEQSDGALINNNPLTMAALACSLAGFVCLVFAGWFGGKLVYGHGVGVSDRSPR